MPHLFESTVVMWNGGEISRSITSKNVTRMDVIFSARTCLYMLKY